MPVKVDRLVQLLTQTAYPPDEIAFLKQGFEQGFDIGYDGSKVRQSVSENIPFTVGNEVELWNKLMKEVKLGRVAGPFEHIPFDNFIQSPIGLVPKAGGDQTRLIFHLSYDFKDGLKLLNHHTPRELCTVKYKDLDFAVQVYLQLCEEILQENEIGAQSSLERVDLCKCWQKQFEVSHKRKVISLIFARKLDIRSTFRILGL